MPSRPPADSSRTSPLSAGSVPADGTGARSDDPSTRSTSGSRLGRGALLGLSLLFLVALGIRVGALVELSNTDPFFTIPIVDELTNYYDAIAIHEQGWPDAPFWKPPLYPYFIAATFGGDPPDRHTALYGEGSPSFWGLKLAQAVLDSISVLLIVLIGWKVGGARANPVGWIASGIYALAFTPVYYVAQILDTTLFVFLCLLAVYLAIKARETDDFVGWAIAGMVVGIAGITRAPALLFAPVVAALPIWEVYRSRAKSRRAPAVEPRSPSTGPPTRPSTHPLRAIAMSAVVAFGVIAALFPVALVNHRIGQDDVLVSSNGGINFYIGNRRGGGVGADGMTSVVAGPRWRALLAEVDTELPPSERSREYYRLAFQEIAADPGAFAVRLLRKSIALIDAYEIPNNKNFEEERARSDFYRWLPGRTGLVFALGLTGLLFFGRRLHHRLPVIGFVAVQAVGIVAFFVAARYRVPILAVMTVPAALLVVELGRDWRVGVRRRVGAALAVLIGLVAFTHADVLGHRERYRDYVVDAVALGYAYERIGEVEATQELEGGRDEAAFRILQSHMNRAIEYYELAIQHDPFYPEAHHNIAHIEIARGQRATAEHRLRSMLKENPWFAEGWSTLGQSLTQPLPGDEAPGADRIREAVSAFEKAVDANPTYPKAIANYGQLLEAMNHTVDALHHYQLARNYALAQDPPPPDTALYFLLEVNLLWKNYRTTEALDLFARLRRDLEAGELSVRDEHRAFYDRVYDQLATYPDGPPGMGESADEGPVPPELGPEGEGDGNPPADLDVPLPDAAMDGPTEDVIRVGPERTRVGKRRLVTITRSYGDAEAEYYFDLDAQLVGVYLDTSEAYQPDQNDALQSIGILDRQQALSYFYDGEAVYEFVPE